MMTPAKNGLLRSTVLVLAS